MNSGVRILYSWVVHVDVEPAEKPIIMAFNNNGPAVSRHWEYSLVTKFGVKSRGAWF